MELLVSCNHLRQNPAVITSLKVSDDRTQTVLSYIIKPRKNILLATPIWKIKQTWETKHSFCMAYFFILWFFVKRKTHTRFYKSCNYSSIDLCCHGNYLILICKINWKFCSKEDWKFCYIYYCTIIPFC